MHNYEIAEYFSLLAKLMDIHGENAFKIKSYSNAAYTLDRLNDPLEEMTPAQIASIRGIGDALAQKIVDLLATKQLAILEEYILKTPPGILEMLKIKGLGPKKIITIWKELGISADEALNGSSVLHTVALLQGASILRVHDVKEAKETIHLVQKLQQNGISHLL